MLACSQLITNFHRWYNLQQLVKFFRQMILLFVKVENWARICSDWEIFGNAKTSAKAQLTQARHQVFELNQHLKWKLILTKPHSWPIFSFNDWTPLQDQHQHLQWRQHQCQRQNNNCTPSRYHSSTTRVGSFESQQYNRV